MRKKLDTRFPAARIKKIMQTDEDVGKIAMAVPLLVSKALELFLQDLCDRTYEVTLRRGAKTMNAFHLKQCVQSCNVFDFLKDIVSKVPDLGGPVAAGGDERTVVTKRRKVAGDDDNDNDSDEEQKKIKTPEPGHSSGDRGRGRGRGRGRPRGSRNIDHDAASHVKYEDDSDVLKHNDNKQAQSNESMENMSEPEDVKPSIPVNKPAEPTVRNFDLNMDPDENMDLLDSLDVPPTPAPAATSAKPSVVEEEEKHEEYPGWSLSEVDKMTIDPVQLANLNRRIDEDDEDYDEEI